VQHMLGLAAGLFRLSHSEKSLFLTLSRLFPDHYCRPIPDLFLQSLAK